MASMIRPEKTKVKWHNFAAKSLVLSPKAQVGAKSSAGGRVSFQIQVGHAKRADVSYWWFAVILEVLQRDQAPAGRDSWAVPSADEDVVVPIPDRF